MLTRAGVVWWIQTAPHSPFATKSNIPPTSTPSRAQLHRFGCVPDPVEWAVSFSERWSRIWSDQTTKINLSDRRIEPRIELTVTTVLTFTIESWGEVERKILCNISGIICVNCRTVCSEIPGTVTPNPVGSLWRHHKYSTPVIWLVWHMSTSVWNENTLLVFSDCHTSVTWHHWRVIQPSGVGQSKCGS